nr:reverse transcriptase domain-containing protein [Aliiruegeria sabulilitoris]
MTRGLETALDALVREVRRGRYQPGPLRAVPIPKRDGSTRVLRIPCLRDRVLQGAVASVLVPVLDPLMHPGSFAYRPGRSVPLALRSLRRGQGWALDADIRSFFDEIGHHPLRRVLKQKVSCLETRQLIGIWLGSFGRRGLAQGSPISPLLANTALGPLDSALSKHGRLVRYADDFVVVCADKAGAREARRTAEQTLRFAGLRLHPDKTRIVPPGMSFTFLGTELVLHSRDRRPQKQLKNKMKLSLRRETISPGEHIERVLREGWKNMLNLTGRS